MRIVSIRELRAGVGRLRRSVEAGEELVLAANGRPFAFIARFDGQHLEEELLALRRARADMAVRRIRTKAAADKLDRLTIREIDALIAKTRRERASAR
jgi:antitoxin (DNA-binding transcriptional repressor) of toxin-antitoxin stability system